LGALAALISVVSEPRKPLLGLPWDALDLAILLIAVVWAYVVIFP
jgi:hypothetical protein